jgi:uncharacterized protein (TIGR02246 family)
MRPIILAAALALVAGPALADDAAEIRAGIRQIADAALTQDHAATMAPFHRDVILSHPGYPDVGYDAISATFARGLKSGPMKVTAEVQEVEVVGDLAYARILWSAKPAAAPPEAEPRREVDLEIWRRTPEGWRLYRGLAAGLKPAGTAAPAAK